MILLLLSLLLCLLCTSSHALSIASFWLVDTTHGTYIRQLRSNTFIAVSYNYTIVAQLSGHATPTPSSVTFTHPFYHVERHVPYVLSGNWPTFHNGSTVYRPLFLPPGTFRFSAYPDDNPAAGLTITNVTVYAMRSELHENGPMPSEIEPTNDSNYVDIPLQPDSCMQVPVFKFISWQKSSYNMNEMMLAHQLQYCETASIRRRLLEYRVSPGANESVHVETSVLSSVIEKMDYLSQYLHVEMQYCTEKRIFVEYCVLSHAVGGDVVCDTSPILSLPAAKVPAPRIAFRPPLHVTVAPGDDVQFKMGVSEWVDDSMDGYWNGKSNRNLSFVIQVVVERSDGVVQVSPAVVNNFTNVSIRIDAQHNGTLVYLQYATMGCRANTDSFRNLYATKVIVDPTGARLIQQDTQLPQLEQQPVYPKTQLGKPVYLSVNASNAGGGIRADPNTNGTQATKLSYQWYIRTQMYNALGPSYIEPIAGATAHTLLLEKAECDGGFFGCGRWGCSGLRRYFVDVCNTFGCRRSDAILPDVIPPQGLSLEEVGCVGTG